MIRRSPLATALLIPPAAAFGLAVRLRNAWYDRPSAARAAGVPVFSVGNLAVGGTGKTPLVAWLARRLQAAGMVPAVVSRGYGGTAGPGPLLVSTGEGPRVNARTCGDEPHLLARTLPGTIVVVGSDRVEGARRAASAGASVVILDDGFQHRRLARDLDIVVLDGRAPLDAGRLLPAGLLREPPDALRRAHVVVLTRIREGDLAAPATDAVRRSGFGGPVLRAGHRTTGFAAANGAASHPPPRAIAFCGIGDPHLFRADLEAAGVAVAALHTFRDHHPYTMADWTALLAAAQAKRVPLVTTEKDLSRLAATLGASLAGAPLLVMRIEAVVWDAVPLWEAARRALAARSRAGR
jgi:tetraacyldisaccharide 4'-kinase